MHNNGREWKNKEQLMYFKKNNLLVKLHLAFSISFLMKMPTGVFDPETNV